MTWADELAKTPPGRREGIEFLERESTVGIRAPEVRKLSRKLLCQAWVKVNRFFDAGTDLDMARIQANLPGMRRRNDNLAANELAPVQYDCERLRRAAGYGSRAHGPSARLRPR